MSDKESNKSQNLSDIYSTTYKFFGIPVFSITKSLVLDEKALYGRMEKKFEKRMTKALDKTLGSKNA